MTKLIKTVMLTVMLMFRASVFALEPVKYLDENGQEQWVTDYTVLEKPSDWNKAYRYDVELTDGWYVVNSSLYEVSDAVVKKGGDIHLIIADNCTCNISLLRIDTFAQYDTSIHVYSQSHGTSMGKLVLKDCYYYDCINAWIINGCETIVKGIFLSHTFISCSSFVMNGGTLSFDDGIEKAIGCRDMFLNGGYINVVNPMASVSVGHALYFGHSFCDFIGDLTQLLYFGDEDIHIAEGVTVKMNDTEYKGSIPFDITDNVNINHVESKYDPAVAVYNLYKDNSDFNAWFTLDGVHLASKPTSRGVYLHGKKKVFVK